MGKDTGGEEVGGLPKGLGLGPQQAESACGQPLGPSQD